MEILNKILGVCSGFSTLLILFSVVYCFGFRKRKYFALRLLIVPIFILATTNNFVSEKLKLTEAVSRLYEIIPYINTFYILNSLICVGILLFLFDENASSLIFGVIIAYISEHMCSHVKQLSAWLIQGTAKTLPWYSMLIEICFAVALAVVIGFLLRNNFNKGIVIRRKAQISFVILVIVALMGISSYVYSFVLFSLVTDLYEILISILLFVLLFSIFRYSAKEHDEIVVAELLDEQIRQTVAYNENYEFVNMQLHDLKKRISGLEEISDDPAIEKLNAAAATYETHIATGNSSLDIVIREYALTCLRKGIRFYCLADGKAVNFLSQEDIYGIFHNSLSNAVEASFQTPKECRYVSLKVATHGNAVRISVENNCNENLQADGKDFSTTKEEKEKHGFGLKSIRYVVAKYNGNVTVTAKDGKFSLNILFLR